MHERSVRSGNKQASSKIGLRIFCVAVGLTWAALSGKGKDHSASLDMIFLSIMVFAPCVLYFWAEIRQRFVLVGFGLGLVAHLLTLYVFKGLFPISTILIVIPLALGECVMIALIILKAIEYGERYS